MYFSPVQKIVGFREVYIHVLVILNGTAHLCDSYKAGNLLWKLMIPYKWPSVIGFKPINILWNVQMFEKFCKKWEDDRPSGSKSKNLASGKSK